MELVWQPCLKQLPGCDLVIIEQANRLLLNYFLLAGRAFKKRKVAYWGHGKNLQSGNDSRFREAIKRALVSNVDWWFAYTQLSADTVIASGFPKERITVVQNSIDTYELNTVSRGITASQLDALKVTLGIDGDKIGLYCGGMYPDKKIDFLLDACMEIKSCVPDFHMLFVGSGPDQYKVERAAHQFTWIHYIGPKFGPDRVPYFMISKVLLIPGPVGLAIVDSFAAQTPLFTTDIIGHGPEIAYLENGINGVMVAYSKQAYVAAVAEYLNNENMQKKLRRGCLHSSEKYTIENMVQNFFQGIMTCLGH
jgi:glycosyltransferase involved in cell wall biosynthesis